MSVFGAASAGSCCNGPPAPGRLILAGSQDRLPGLAAAPAAAAGWMASDLAGDVERDLAHRLTPCHDNFGRRLVKTPGFCLHDNGLAAWLPGVTDHLTAP